MSDVFARTPRPPYYAVIFSSQRRSGDAEGYRVASDRMVELARDIEGFLGVETARDAAGFGVTVSYWSSEEAIRAWKTQSEHTVIRERARWLWYEHFEVRVSKVERAYGAG